MFEQFFLCLKVILVLFLVDCEFFRLFFVMFINFIMKELYYFNDVNFLG